jgi:asparagine synthase (glutamine-hydrolysing)
MLSLVSEVKRVSNLGIKGDLAEFGIALGGSSIIIANLRNNRKFAGYDVFGMIPAPTSKDGADAHSRYDVIATGNSTGLSGKQYYGYQSDLYTAVVTAFKRHGLPVDHVEISLHKGLFAETFKPSPSDRLAFAHIDCDWYEPVYYCLTNISSILSPGGTVIVDDFNDYEGCRTAVKAVLAEDPTLTLRSTEPHAVIRKLSTAI